MWDAIQKNSLSSDGGWVLLICLGERGGQGDNSVFVIWKKKKKVMHGNT